MLHCEMTLCNRHTYTKGTYTAMGVPYPLILILSRETLFQCSLMVMNFLSLKFPSLDSIVFTMPGRIQSNYSSDVAAACAIMAFVTVTQEQLKKGHKQKKSLLASILVTMYCRCLSVSLWCNSGLQRYWSCLQIILPFSWKLSWMVCWDTRPGLRRRPIDFHLSDNKGLLKAEDETHRVIQKVHPNTLPFGKRIMD